MSRLGSAAGSTEYAHARMRARWGARPDETAWHRIEITRELAPLLEMARAAALAHWVRGLPGLPGPRADDALHAIEHALRRRWREAVEEVADWVGGEWQPAVRWCAHLADLPAVQQWARGEPVAAWTAADELLAPCLGGGDDGPVDAARFAPAWRALVETARSQPADIAALWLQAWRRLLPAGPARDVIERELVRPLAAHTEAFVSPSTVDGWSARRALAARLVGLLRRHPAEPLEAFVYVALMALELETPARRDRRARSIPEADLARMIRPRPARWFELLVARDDTTLALEALAATGAVELETRHGATLPGGLGELQPLLQRFDGLVQRYGAWWPTEGLVASSVPEPPQHTLQRCLDRLLAWAAEAEPLIRRLQEAEAEAEEIARWQRVVEHLDDGRIDLGLAAAASAATAGSAGSDARGHAGPHGRSGGGGPGQHLGRGRAAGPA